MKRQHRCQKNQIALKAVDEVSGSTCVKRLVKMSSFLAEGTIDLRIVAE